MESVRISSSHLSRKVLSKYTYNDRITKEHCFNCLYKLTCSVLTKQLFHLQLQMLQWYSKTNRLTSKWVNRYRTLFSIKWMFVKKNFECKPILFIPLFLLLKNNSKKSTNEFYVSRLNNDNNNKQEYAVTLCVYLPRDNAWGIYWSNIRDYNSHISYFIHLLEIAIYSKS